MKITMYNAVKVDNYFYFVCYDMNLLCRWNIYRCDMDIIGSAPEEPMFVQGLFGNLLYAEGILFLIPFNAEFLWEYVIKDERWLKIQLPKTECKEHKFYAGVIINNYLYLLGYAYPAILKMEISTCKIKMIEIDKGVLQQDYLYSGILGCNYYINDRYIIAPILCNNIILKIDTINESLQYIPINESQIKCVGIAFDGNEYWLAPRYGDKYLIWDGNLSFEEKEISGFQVGGGQYFGSCCIVGKSIIFTSFIGNSIGKKLEKESKWEEIPRTFYFVENISDNELILGTTEDIWWYKDGQKKEINYEISEEKYKKFLMHEKERGRLFSSEEVTSENQFLRLKDFIQLVQEGAFDE